MRTCRDSIWANQKLDLIQNQLTDHFDLSVSFIIFLKKTLLIDKGDKDGVVDKKPILIL
ncbi:unnamed protein product [Trichobilharzia regenti]|nr:unnamed protein product [Trichobilharzia regenti]